MQNDLKSYQPCDQNAISLLHLLRKLTCYNHPLLVLSPVSPTLFLKIKYLMSTDKIKFCICLPNNFRDPKLLKKKHFVTSMAEAT